MELVKMKNSNFKVLLVYANSYMDTLIPVSITCLATSLKRAGFQVKLFDTTFYLDESSDLIRIETGQVKEFRSGERKFPIYKTKVENDFRKSVLEYSPDVIGISCVETTYRLAIRMIDNINDLDIPIVFGGIHTIFSANEVIVEKNIDAVCIGEGEEAIIEFCAALANKSDAPIIDNMWIKRDNEIIKGRKGTLFSFEKNEFIEPNYEIFEEARFYRPMSGKVYRMLPLEISRGCIYKCSYCSAPGLKEYFKDVGQWMRYKNMSAIQKEIEHCIEKYNVEYFYIVSETFLAMPKRRFDEFVEMYSQFKIPFWCNTRPETITEENIKKLESIGCHRMSIGIEHGNEEFRTTMLKRKVSNKRIIETCKIMENSCIQFSVNNIIGFPEETRDLIFDTIEINREFNADSHTVLILQPYRGTWLYDYCVKKGYYSKSQLAKDNSVEPVIRNENLTLEEIKGLQRTFNFYVKFPKSEWPKIKIAEEFTKEGNEVYREYNEKFKEKYL